MLKYLLDTNIVIYTMKNRPQQVKRRFQKHEGEMCISAVTLGELMNLNGRQGYCLRIGPRRKSAPGKELPDHSVNSVKKTIKTRLE